MKKCKHKKVRVYFKNLNPNSHVECCRCNRVIKKKNNVKH